MKTRRLGRTGLQVSEVSLGTWAFASQVYGTVKEKDAFDAVDAALDVGINFFDTAPLYGDEKTNGISETLLGKALGSNRDRVLISTKFGRYSNEGGAANFSPARARESVESSLQRMGTEVIDVLFFHSPFGFEDIHDGVWEELANLKDEGKVRFLGHSISLFDKTEEMGREWARDRKIDVFQVVLSMMNRETSKFITDMGNSDLGIVSRESLANGFLSGRITKETVFPANNLNSRYSKEEIGERVDYVTSLEFLLRGQIKSMPQAALRWVLDQPGVSTVLSGARNRTEIIDCAEASDAEPFDDSEHQRLNKNHMRDFPAA